MRNFMLAVMALAVFALAASVYFHAGTGRYQITYVAGMTGVYKADTRTGELSLCSPLYESGCITMAEAHQHLAQQRENMVNTAKQTSDKIDQFTKGKARDLRNLMDRITPDQEPEPAPQGE